MGDMEKYYIGLDNGHCGIVTVEGGEEAARKRAEQETRSLFGDPGNKPRVTIVRLATKEDLAWVTRMGGDPS